MTGAGLTVLFAPDKLAGTATAPVAAHALAEGWASVRPRDRTEQVPLADGGPGFLDVIARARRGSRTETVTVSDPLGRPVEARVLRDGDTAYVESADAVGLHLLSADERDPMRAASDGLGMLLSAAARGGARRIVVGLGGSATVDGGLGMLRALGVRPVDDKGRVVSGGAAAVRAVRAVVGATALPDTLELVAATDVDNPLTGVAGAALVFGPQKGLPEDCVWAVDAGLGRWSALLDGLDGLDGRDGPDGPAGIASLPGAGAAGGIGAALLALGAQRRSGFEVVAEAVSLDSQVASADLVVTAEGRFDATSMRGKVVGGVIASARRHDRPVVVVAGQVDEGAGVPAGVPVVTLVAVAGTTREAMERTVPLLKQVGADLARRVGDLRASSGAPRRNMG